MSRALGARPVLTTAVDEQPAAELIKLIGTITTAAHTASARLLDLDGMAAYLGISRWTAEELVRAGAVPVCRIPRPRTARALKHDPDGDELRVLRVDKADLDAFIEATCRKERLGVGHGG